MGAGLLAVKSGFILFIKSYQFPLQINTLERERERKRQKYFLILFSIQVFFFFQQGHKVWWILFGGFLTTLAVRVRPLIFRLVTG
jgi:hypothetical protein